MSRPDSLFANLGDEAIINGSKFIRGLCPNCKAPQWVMIRQKKWYCEGLDNIRYSGPGTIWCGYVGSEETYFIKQCTLSKEI